MEAILSGSVGGVNDAPYPSIRAEGVPLTEACCHRQYSAIDLVGGNARTINLGG
jgi:hypothetical protein